MLAGKMPDRRKDFLKNAGLYFDGSKKILNIFRRSTILMMIIMINMMMNMMQIKEC